MFLKFNIISKILVFLKKIKNTKKNSNILLEIKKIFEILNNKIGWKKLNLFIIMNLDYYFLTEWIIWNLYINKDQRFNIKIYFLIIKNIY